MSLRRLSCVLCLLGLLGGCYDHHEVSVLTDGRVIGDAGPGPRDSGWSDVLGSYWNDAAPEGRRDAGVHPRPDAGSSDASAPGDGLGDRWEGYIESYAFDSGSDRIVVQLDTATPGAPASGYVVLGDATPPALPTDPNVGWPVPRPSFAAAIEGYAYRFVDAVVLPDRVRITLDMGSPWRPWCELQYPVPLAFDPTSYACLPNGGGTADIPPMHCSYEDPTTHESLDVDCGRMMLCGFGTGACTCDASSCTSRAVRTFSIDFHVTGDAGTGTIDGHNAYLTR